MDFSGGGGGFTCVLGAVGAARIDVLRHGLLLRG